MSENQTPPAEPHCPECKAKGFENIIAQYEKIQMDEAMPMPLGLELDMVIITCKNCGHVYLMLRPRV